MLHDCLLCTTQGSLSRIDKGSSSCSLNWSTVPAANRPPASSSAETILDRLCPGAGGDRAAPWLAIAPTPPPAGAAEIPSREDRLAALAIDPDGRRLLSAECWRFTPRPPGESVLASAAGEI